ncbi:MAG: hypothetical protein FWD08_00250 [Alphaproteobacteria bacterium]|nr:hypothetical protein [Alphaproteobacteria bacterium]
MTETETKDGWEWWRDALEGRFGPIDANNPQCGFFRSRRKNKQTGEVTYAPVAYWYDKDGKLHCQIDGVDIEETTALEAWPYVSRRPISYELFRAVRNGEPWPDENSVVVDHNRAPVDDSIEAIAERIDDLAREAERMLKSGAAQDQAAADQASDLANTFSELQGKIDNLHKVEKQPFLDGGRAVDKKWFGLRDRADNLKRRLKAVIVGPWLSKKNEEAQAAAAAALAKGTPPEQLPEVKTTAGSSKRSTALRTVATAEVTDWIALLTHVQEHPDIRAAAQKVANASAKAGIELPGMKIVKTKVAA